MLSASKGRGSYLPWGATPTTPRQLFPSLIERQPFPLIERSHLPLIERQPPSPNRQHHRGCASFCATLNGTEGLAAAGALALYRALGAAAIPTKRTNRHASITGGARLFALP